jgi:hypothetical protein
MSMAANQVTTILKSLEFSRENTSLQPNLKAARALLTSLLDTDLGRAHLTPPLQVIYGNERFTTEQTFPAAKELLEVATERLAFEGKLQGGSPDPRAHELYLNDIVMFGLNIAGWLESVYSQHPTHKLSLRDRAELAILFKEFPTKAQATGFWLETELNQRRADLKQALTHLAGVIDQVAGSQQATIVSDPLGDLRKLLAADPSNALRLWYSDILPLAEAFAQGVPTPRVSKAERQVVRLQQALSHNPTPHQTVSVIEARQLFHAFLVEGLRQVIKQPEQHLLSDKLKKTPLQRILTVNEQADINSDGVLLFSKDDSTLADPLFNPADEQKIQAFLKFFDKKTGDSHQVMAKLLGEVEPQPAPAPAATADSSETEGGDSNQEKNDKPKALTPNKYPPTVIIDKVIEIALFELKPTVEEVLAAHANITASDRAAVYRHLENEVSQIATVALKTDPVGELEKIYRASPSFFEQKFEDLNLWDGLSLTITATNTEPFHNAAVLLMNEVFQSYATRAGYQSPEEFVAGFADQVITSLPSFNQARQEQQRAQDDALQAALPATTEQLLKELAEAHNLRLEEVRTVFASNDTEAKNLLIERLKLRAEIVNWTAEHLLVNYLHANQLSDLKVSDLPPEFIAQFRREISDLLTPMGFEELILLSAAANGSAVAVSYRFKVLRQLSLQLQVNPNLTSQNPVLEAQSKQLKQAAEKLIQDKTTQLEEQLQKEYHLNPFNDIELVRESLRTFMQLYQEGETPDLVRIIDGINSEGHLKLIFGDNLPFSFAGLDEAEKLFQIDRLKEILRKLYIAEFQKLVINTPSKDLRNLAWKPSDPNQAVNFDADEEEIRAFREFRRQLQEEFAASYPGATSKQVTLASYALADDRIASDDEFFSQQLYQRRRQALREQFYQQMIAAATLEENAPFLENIRAYMRADAAQQARAEAQNRQRGSLLARLRGRDRDQQSGQSTTDKIKDLAKRARQGLRGIPGVNEARRFKQLWQLAQLAWTGVTTVVSAISTAIMAIPGGALIAAGLGAAIGGGFYAFYQSLAGSGGGNALVIPPTTAPTTVPNLATATPTELATGSQNTFGPTTAAESGLRSGNTVFNNLTNWVNSGSWNVVSVAAPAGTAVIAIAVPLIASPSEEAFLRSFPTVTNNQISRFVEIQKTTAEGSKFETPEDLSYSIRIRAKQGFCITFASAEGEAGSAITDVFNLEANTEKNPTLASTSDMTDFPDSPTYDSFVENLDTFVSENPQLCNSDGAAEWTTVGSYLMPFKSGAVGRDYNHASIINTVTARFTVTAADGTPVKDDFGLVDTTLQGTVLEGIVSNSICFGECPRAEACWPTTGTITQTPFQETWELAGDPSHKSDDAYDIGAPKGSPVYAPYSGTLYKQTQHVAYGVWLQLQPQGEDFILVFYHLGGTTFDDEDESVKTLEVSAGDRIGSVDSTGNSSGPHLHLGYKPVSEPSKLNELFVPGGQTLQVGKPVETCYSEETVADQNDIGT